MPNANTAIKLIALQGIAQIQDQRLRDALEAAYASECCLRAVETASRLFERFAGSDWSDDALCRFLSGWRAMHGTALYVSGLVVRLQREAQKAGPDERALLFQAAAEVGTIIAEDTGVDDVPHQELFATFANCLAGSDRWQLACFSTSECESFRAQVKHARLRAPIEEAILTTAASESWNSGEYTYVDPLMKAWLLQRRIQTQCSDDPTAYVGHHAGDTELGHFLHAIRAWDLYCEASGLDPDPLKARMIFESYFLRIGVAFQALEKAFE